jgi:PAS domain S-box-containing protein
LEAAAYRRLLIRLLALPIATLAVLAVTLVLGFQMVQRSARRVDRADQVIAHANNLFKLMVDEETGLRGFLLTHDSDFLQPYKEASQRLDREFATLFDLIKRTPDQTQRLERLQAASRTWQQHARELIAQASSSAPQLESEMRERKQEMDNLRSAADDFLSAETAIRASRSFSALRIDNATLYGLVGLAIVLAALLAWQIRRLFGKLAGEYNLQLDEVRRWGNECFSREQWLNTTLRSIGDAVIACDPAGHVVFMNAVAEQLTGWREKEAEGRPLVEIFHILNQRTRAVVENPVEAVRRLGKIVGLANHTILVSKAGTEFNVDDSAAPILDKDGGMTGIVLVFRDVSERYASEHALMRAEKLASAGRLAASIAHEVNNPLEGLVNLVYLARGENDIQQVRRHLTDADRELQRIAHITRQSLGFYREHTLPTLFRPDVVTREVFEFYSFRATAARVSLHVNIKTEQKVWGNPGELRQVISNLVANSLDACRAGSDICVRVHASHNWRVNGLEGVRVMVADNGYGIAAENLDRIFEPFFTTKKDTGTGLGLWVSRELIEKYGGYMHVRSRVNGGRPGTIFALFLPGTVGAEAAR